MTTTEAELEQIMSKPEYASRVAVRVFEEGSQYVAEWAGVEYRAGNMFGLDSKLDAHGVPAPRNLFLMEGTR